MNQNDLIKYRIFLNLVVMFAATVSIGVVITGNHSAAFIIMGMAILSELNLVELAIRFKDDGWMR